MIRKHKVTSQTQDVITVPKRAAAIYGKREKRFSDALAKKKRTSNIISNIRLAVIVLGIASTVYFYIKDHGSTAALAGVLTFGLFIYLLRFHERIKGELRRLQVLVDLNKRSLRRIEGNWTDFSEDGGEYLEQKHPYGEDLDILGHASLYQWISAVTTAMGKERLRDLLASPEKEPNIIGRRQEAIRELAGRLEWRQSFQSEGLVAFKKPKDPKRLLEWIESPNRQHQHLLLTALRVLPLVTNTYLAVAYLVPAVSYRVPVVLIAIQLLITVAKYKRANEFFAVASYYAEDIKAYYHLLKMIEQEDFSSEHLARMKKRLHARGKKWASERIRRLSFLADLTELRYSFFHFIINVLTLWDHHCMVALEDWKMHSGPNLSRWLAVLGEFEALSSLSGICHDQPHWAFPEITGEEQFFAAKDIGHPLIFFEERVCNDIQFRGPGSIVIITGSNMSGKSTFLRTVGINLVLAYAGAPVCADKMTCSIMNLYSSMNIKDDLENRISSFYAELLRVKMIIDASKNEEPILFLLDEIFRGTNSRDRHLGAKTVIRNLSQAGAIGLVSTHDLELGALAHESGLLENRHFRETFRNGEIHFDYKLRPGVSTTTNAVHLMKMVGIQFDEK